MSEKKQLGGETMKKNTWKKILAASAAAVMLASAFTGCGKQETPPSTENPAIEKNEEQKTETSGKKQVLTLMAVGGSNEQAFVDTVTAAADRFNADNEFNAEVKLEWYENEQYKTKLATLMTQNDVTDIFFTWEAGFMKDYVESGRVYSLSDALAADPAWNDRFHDGAFSAVTFDDQVYAMPMGQAITPIYYNKTIFKDCGLTVPETWDEFLNVVKTVKDAGFVPMSMVAQDAWIPGQLMLDISGGVGGSDLYEGVVAGTAQWDDERYVKTGELMSELVEMGAFAEGFLGMSYDEGRSMFTDGKAAMYPMGTWDTSAVIAGMGGSENIGVFFIPAFNPEFQGVRISSVEKLFAVSEKCENKEAAVAFLKELSSDATETQYVLDCGGLPSTNVAIDPSMVDPVTLEIMEMQKQVTNALTPMDRQFGANVGGEFNNISLAIAGGKDSGEQFAALATYAAQEADR